MKGTIAAALALAASVAASGSDLSSPTARLGWQARAPVTARDLLGGRLRLRGAAPMPVAAAAPATREFRFRDLVFTVPAAWRVQRADSLPFRTERVSVTGLPSGPRLTFSDSVQFVRDGSVMVGGAGAPVGNGLSMQRFEMPNPLTRAVVYVFPEAGVSISAQVRTDDDARAADAVAQSARRALPPPAPARG